MMSARTGTSSFGHQTGAPVARATGATAPMWSKCVCVSRIASSVTPSCSIAPRSRSGSSPGSIMTPRSAPPRRSRNVFSWTGPTVKARTSMSAATAPLGELGLAAVVEERVGEVADRQVQQQHEAAERDRAPHRLTERKHDDEHEQERRDERAV